MVASETILNSWSMSFWISAKETDSITSAREFFSKPSLVNTWTSITVPSCPALTLKEVSLTSDAFSPKIALKSFSSGESCVSPFGVTLPTRISPAFTSAPMWTIPHSSSFDRADSPTLGISAVISSGPSFVSLAVQVSSIIWTLVSLSSLTNLSEIKIESSKL